MNWSLGQPVSIAGVKVCALSASKRNLSRSGQGFLGRGSKVPQVIFLIRDGKISGVDMAGRRVGENDLRLRFPGALENLKNLK